MKKCNVYGYCNFKKQEGSAVLCAYPDYCDYQLPRDSRGKEEQFLQRALGIIEDMITERKNR